MIVNAHTLKTLLQAFTSLYTDAFKAAPSDYEKVAMVVTSTSTDQKYGWLGQFKKLREWVGDRVVNNLKNHGFTITNKTFELTQAVQREAIEDDLIGQYSPLFQQMGYDAATHPDELVFALLKGGFTGVCYDGQYFFDTDHPVIDETGAEVSASNSGGGSGAAWFLVDATRPIKPLIFQKRRDYSFTSMDDAKDENVFMRNEYLYGIDARVNAGYGLWQLAYGSKQTLDATSYAAARTAMTGRKGDNGKVLGVRPNLLIVGPSNEKAALEIAKAERNSAGATNVWQGTVEVLVVPYLD